MSQDDNSPQVGIIIVAHGDYADTLLRTAEFILGSLTDCTSISIDAAFEVSDTVSRLEDAASRLDQGAGVIVLTDMFGGTPTNISLALLAKYNVEVITGVNLPMILKVFSSRTKPLHELSKIAEDAGKNGIVAAASMLGK